MNLIQKKLFGLAKKDIITYISRECVKLEERISRGEKTKLYILNGEYYIELLGTKLVTLRHLVKKMENR